MKRKKLFTTRVTTKELEDMRLAAKDYRYRSVAAWIRGEAESLAFCVRQRQAEKVRDEKA